MNNAEQQNRAQRLWSQEGGHCVSYLVSALASGQCTAHDSREIQEPYLADLCEQAAELCYPIPDYEEAAIQEGWEGPFKDKFSATYFKDTSDGQTWACEDWKDLCHEHGIEPCDRDVFEHWVVSNWLADKLTERGEKVDKDFAGLCVWARCTTGQSIIIDSVFEAITREVMGEAKAA